MVPERKLRVLASSIERERENIYALVDELGYDFTNPILLERMKPLEEMINTDIRMEKTQK